MKDILYDGMEMCLTRRLLLYFNQEEKMYKDKSGMFKDFNFKLVVLNSLLGKETFFVNDAFPL